MEFNCHLCIGPHIREGFYYEMGMPEDRPVVQPAKDFPALESRVKGIVKEKQPFERFDDRCVRTGRVGQLGVDLRSGGVLPIGAPVVSADGALNARGVPE
ncbi:MAG: hypothetical protein SGCHY_004974, partial [Lobulomycetales sp.]